MKRIFPTFIATTLVLSGLCFSQIKNVGASTRSGLASVQARASSIRFAARFIRGANGRRRYTIKAKYPQAVGTGAARLVKLNQVITDLITKEVNQFKKEAGPPEGPRLTSISSFESDYTVGLATGDLVSISLFINTYFEGAAHGLDRTVVLNYDLSSGRVLKLADLFKPKSNYLKLISDYSIKAIKEELGADADNDWIQRGAEATEENYKNWNITRKGLEIYFERYQVAPYVTPPPDIVIPYGDLKNVIDPAGPLARVAGKQ
jgi:hypothetical protein